jgi:hypothetical protein
MADFADRDPRSLAQYLMFGVEPGPWRHSPLSRMKATDQLVETSMQPVTQTADRTAAERKRRQRERQRAVANARAPLERADWQLFLRPETLARTA